MFGEILKKIFGTSSDRQMKSLIPLVEEVNALGEGLKSFTDEELIAKTESYRERILEYNREIREEIEKINEDLATELGDEIRERAEDRKEELLGELHNANQQILEEIMPEAFALVREVCYRLTGKEFIAAGQRMSWGDDVSQFYSADDFEWTERTPPGYTPRMVAELPERIAHSLTNSFTLVRFEDGRIFRAIIPFDVQIIGGVVLHQGKIAEMATGEGKTLAAVFPVFLNALTGRGVHVVTVNDYLAQRDAEWMGQIYEFLGLTVGCIHHGVEPGTPERKAQYDADITYGTNNEFGFDYLRDNLSRRKEERVQREFHYAIVDEVDSVLIDEARTPLIISGPVDSKIHETFSKYEPGVRMLVRKQASQSTSLLSEAEKELEAANFFADSGEQDKDAIYRAGEKLLMVKRSTPKISRFLKLMKEPGIARLIQRVEGDRLRDKIMHELDEELFFAVDEQENSINLSEKGRQSLDSRNPEIFELPDITAIISEIEGNEELDEQAKLEEKKNAYALYSERTTINHAISQLLKAHVLFEKDVDYIVDEAKVIIVDSFTGRPMPGRRFSDGLHQALEAKESVNVQSETQTIATITLQNFFRMFDKLAGMTGTAETEANEFWEIYKLDVVVIPPNRPVRRNDYEDLVYMTRREKYNAALDEIEYWHEKGRPILVGTVSVEVSETLSRMLSRRKIPHHVLNAKQHEKEALVVADAGKPGAVTIATNMAGRGTDIKLGASVVRCPEGCHLLSDNPNDMPVAGGEWTLGDCRKEVPCGLHIIGTERHDSRRIDRQLRGRAGRQGDPGSSRFYLSLEDDLMRLFGSERVSMLMGKLGAEEGEVITHSMITKSIERAQKRVEAQNFSIRKHLLEYD
ncbi:MAG TPA: preprotein translocase subunit SecA, partial [candidate division Zixibacteria bacterium]|nr:preprotein translocase subunit SecA [candidate division Zixibacteria bacterium]